MSIEAKVRALTGMGAGWIMWVLLGLSVLVASVAIERAMVLAEGDQIVASDLPERVRESQDPVQMQLQSGELSVKKTTRVIEEVLIRRALQKTKGNRTRAAELLEISHRALLYKIKDYQITDL